MIDQKIVFYDGECGFCNRSVKFIFEHEKNAELTFAALQSDFTRSFFEQRGKQYPKSFDSIIYFDGNHFFDKSTAALKILSSMKSPYSLLKIFIIVPGFIRNPIYDFVARNRKKISGDYCFLPNTEQRKRIIS